MDRMDQCRYLLEHICAAGTTVEQSRWCMQCTSIATLILPYIPCGTFRLQDGPFDKIAWSPVCLLVPLLCWHVHATCPMHHMQAERMEDLMDGFDTWRGSQRVADTVTLQQMWDK